MTTETVKKAEPWTDTLEGKLKEEAEKRRGVLVKDPEIVAMSDIASVLDGIRDDAVRLRVLRWASDRYGLETWAFEATRAAEQEGE